MRVTREELQRCQFSVFDPSDPDNGFSGECGEPAVARWSWPPGLGEEIYVCEKHDLEVAEREEKPREWPDGKPDWLLEWEGRS